MCLRHRSLTLTHNYFNMQMQKQYVYVINTDLAILTWIEYFNKEMFKWYYQI